MNFVMRLYVSIYDSFILMSIPEYESLGAGFPESLIKKSNMLLDFLGEKKLIQIFVDNN